MRLPSTNQQCQSTEGVYHDNDNTQNNNSNSTNNY